MIIVKKLIVSISFSRNTWYALENWYPVNIYGISNFIRVHGTGPAKC